MEIKEMCPPEVGKISGLITALSAYAARLRANSGRRIWNIPFRRLLENGCGIWQDCIHWQQRTSPFRRGFFVALNSPPLLPPGERAVSSYCRIEGGSVLLLPRGHRVDSLSLVRLLMPAAMILLLASCALEPSLDRAKFAGLNKAAQELKAAIKSGKSCESAGSLSMELSSGTAALQKRTSSKADRDLLSAFAHLSAITKDGVLLCQSRSLLSGFPFLPKGRIYVSQELDPIVEKYDISTQTHVYGPTGKHWRSISDDSISIVWGSAEAEIQHIENMVKYSE